MAAPEIHEEHVVGERVLCFEPDETKARVLYNAKIIAAGEVKDVNGKKVMMEYKIHFQGWNSTWDRWADESFVLKDNEENRKLQRKLARRAIRKLKKSQKGKKRHHLPGVAGDVKRIPNEQDLGTDTSSDDESVTSSVATSGKGIITDTDDDMPPEKRKKLQLPETPVMSPAQQSESSSTDILVPPPPTPKRTNIIDIPYQLQRRLEDDEMMINSKGMLVKLPVTRNVVQILENFVKYFAMNVCSSADKIKTQLSSSQEQITPEKRISLCQEVCSDLRVLFDFSLPLVLLYVPEKHQFRQIIKTISPCVSSTKQQEPKKSSSTTKSAANHKSEKFKIEKCTENETNHSSNNVNKQNNNNNVAQNHTFQNGEVAKVKSSTRKKINNKKIKHERKTAEVEVIEETNKYILPSPAMRDNTGLSSDAHGRRRSRRLSHCDVITNRLKENENPTSENNKPTATNEGMLTSDFNSLNKDNGFVMVNSTSEIFLRRNQKSMKHLHGSNGIHVDKSTPNNVLSKECFLEHAGNDINRIVELSKVWKWRIFPSGFHPVDGANTPPSLIYGIQHFLRMFVKLPDIISRMDIPDFKMKVLLKHLYCLLKFLKEHECELYEFDCYVTRL